MAYTPDAGVFAAQIAAARQVVGVPVWAGIGAYRLTPARTVEHIEAARRLAPPASSSSRTTAWCSRRAALTRSASIGRAAFTP